MSKMSIEHGAQVWRNEAGQAHREDGPAYIHLNGYQLWYINGLHHRIDGPAVIRADGSQAWYLNDQVHREDGPAIFEPDGAQLWALNGKTHRACGPAIVYPTAARYWWTSISHLIPAKNHHKSAKEYWIIHEQEITSDVLLWMNEMNIEPNYKLWTDKEKMWFMLRFGSSS